MENLNKTVAIEMVEVNKSEAFKAIGYDESTSTLRLVFENEEAYRYAPVGMEIFNALNIAPSLGKAFHADVRNDPKIDFWAESEK